jgi:hypothetical protein
MMDDGGRWMMEVDGWMMDDKSHKKRWIFSKFWLKKVKEMMDDGSRWMMEVDGWKLMDDGS